MLQRMVFGPIVSISSAMEAQRKQKEANKRTRAIADDQARQMCEVVKPAWFDPKRSDFWNDPNRWDGIDDPHTEIFWMKRRVDRIDCAAVKSTVHPKKRNIEIISNTAWLQRGLR